MHTLTRSVGARQVLHQLPEKPTTLKIESDRRIPIRMIAKSAQKGEDLILSRGPGGIQQSACQVPILTTVSGYEFKR